MIWKRFIKRASAPDWRALCMLTDASPPRSLGKRKLAHLVSAEPIICFRSEFKHFPGAHKRTDSRVVVLSAAEDPRHLLLLYFPFRRNLFLRMQGEICSDSWSTGLSANADAGAGGGISSGRTHTLGQCSACAGDWVCACASLVGGCREPSRSHGSLRRLREAYPGPLPPQRARQSLARQVRAVLRVQM